MADLEWNVPVYGLATCTFKCGQLNVQVCLIKRDKLTHQFLIVLLHAKVMTNIHCLMSVRIVSFTMFFFNIDGLRYYNDDQ